jgi:hypothetical protein
MTDAERQRIMRDLAARRGQSRPVTER